MKLYKLGILILCAGLISCSKEERTLNVIPLPQEVEFHKGGLDLAGATISCDPAIVQAGKDYIAAFASLLEEKLPLKDKGPVLSFTQDPSLAPEEYCLEVSSKALEVKASELNGFVYAIQTIKQLLPAGIYDKNSGRLSEECRISAMSVRDWPRFAYRGMHMDCARHIFPLEEVYRYIDIMEIHKLNRLHWHLTDDQGWRIELKSYPRISEVGSMRKGTMIGKDFSSNDGIPYGGLYTQQELREVVAYAAARGITIVPEIDLPGHTQAIVAAYPELGCTGGPYEVRCTWGVSDDVICAGNEKNFTILKAILDEVMDIFPSEYIHIGGDECPKVRWEACPKCQKKIKELGLKDDAEFKAEDYLQSYVMNRVESYLNAHGRKVIGWDEVLDGNVSQSATIMSWRGAAGGIKAAQSGRDAIMTPNSYLYFDYCQARASENEPLSIGGYLPITRVYSYEPYDEQMTAQECTRILGVQANLWTEYIATSEHLEYMLLPRLSALSEVQWCRPEIKDFERFRASLWNMKGIYDALGMNYATHVFDGRLDDEDKKAGRIGHKAKGKKAELLSKPHLNYRFHAPDELLDGLQGDRVFTSGAWIGFEGEPMSVVIEMGRTAFSKVAIEYLSDKGGYIFAPVWMQISTSDNGKDFSPLAEVRAEPEGADDPDGIRRMSVDLGCKTKAKYLKVEARTIDVLPDWHPGAGAKAFLFVDEIIVD
ncbi:MAG: beta-N-acetylhexosaminidase [Candidatus Cryptobacteroides sp.]